MDLQHWDRGQIRDFHKEVWSSVGADGWALLVPRIQKALIAEKVLKVVVLQSTMPEKAAVLELREALMSEAGLEEA